MVSRRPRDSYDAVVIGARIAGSTVAALLGDDGARVLLVERVRFPRTTISTHFFRGAGPVAILDRLTILDDVLATRYGELRDASLLESFAECTSLARDLSRLALPSAG